MHESKRTHGDDNITPEYYEKFFSNFLKIDEIFLEMKLIL